MTTRMIAAIVLATMFLCAAASADTVVLNNGKTIDGAVMKSGDRYWVQTSDGKSQFIDASDVKEVISAGHADDSAAAPASGTPSFYVVRAKAEIADNPLAAMALWQKFIDAKPSAADLAKANDEMAKWKARNDDHAEKINGAWVGGADLQKIIDQVTALEKEGVALMQEQKTLAALEKFQEAVKIYPNSYILNSYLGYISVLSHKEDDAMTYFLQCEKLQPDAPDAMNNMAVMLWNKKQYERALDKFRAAAEAGDDIGLALNLNKAIRIMPPSMQGSEKKAIEAAGLLYAKYNLQSVPNWTLVNWYFMKPRRPAAAGGAAGMPAGWIASGTGFIVSADGLILTNRHVVEGGKNLLVFLDGGVKTSAEVVDIDQAQDLALIRIKGDKKFPTVKISNADAPAEGADCYALGFPMIDQLGGNIKVTRGIVSGDRPKDAVDILTDTKVNPGNSGGPLLGKHGEVIGIVTMKSMTSSMEDSYGMAISAGHIRQFLAEQHVTVAAPDAAAPVLSTEDVVANVKPATVCIISTH